MSVVLPEAPRLGFRPDIEGLRAVAVALVVLLHAGLAVLSGGYTGVDVFFVISGFLITSLLVDEVRATRRVSILGFYARRARRILPVACFVIAVTVVAAYFQLGPLIGRKTALDGRWAAGFAANLRFIHQGTDYFASDIPPSPLQAFLVPRRRGAILPGLADPSLCAGCVRPALRPVGHVVASRAVRRRCCVPLLVRASEHARSHHRILLTVHPGLGTRCRRPNRCLCSRHRQDPWRPSHGERRGSDWAASSLPDSRLRRRPSSPVMLRCCRSAGTVLVIAGGMGDPRRSVSTLLSLSPLRWLGRISYSVYLWHWPVLMIRGGAVAGDAEFRRTHHVWSDHARALGGELLRHRATAAHEPAPQA